MESDSGRTVYLAIMRAGDPPITLHYERKRPHDVAYRLEQRADMLCTFARRCPVSAAFAIGVAFVALLLGCVMTRLSPTGALSDEWAGAIGMSIGLPVVAALVAFPVGVVMQALGDQYHERADVLRHLERGAILTR